MKFNGINETKIGQICNFANMLFKNNIEGLGEFEKRILYFSIIDFHHMLFNEDVSYDDILYILDKYGETIGIDFNNPENKVAEYFWKIILTKTKDGCECLANEFVLYVKNVQSDLNAIRFLEKKVKIYFPDLKDSVIKKYNFILLHSNYRGGINKHVVRFFSDSNNNVILKAAETLSPYLKGYPVASYMRNSLKQYGCNIIDCYARDNVYQNIKNDDVSRIYKAVNNIDKEDILALLDDNDEFFGAIDSINYINIISISKIDNKHIGATLIKQKITGDFKFSVDVVSIHDDSLNVCWHSEKDEIIINPCNDGNKVVKLMLFAEDM